MGGDAFLDDFDGPDLDTEVWVPQYLPMWSSRAESAATYAVAESELRLTIPPEQGLWCAGDHEPSLRVSGIQSGVWSGPAGGTRGQQPFRDGTVVREFQPARWGWTPRYGHLEVRARMDLGPRSMASAWMVGREAEPTEGGEICLVEVLPIDVADFHVYAADWRPGRVDFSVDGEHVRTVHQAPAYPMQMMIAVFDFRARTAGAPARHVPQLAVDSVRGETSR